MHVFVIQKIYCYISVVTKIDINYTVIVVLLDGFGMNVGIHNYVVLIIATQTCFITVWFGSLKYFLRVLGRAAKYYKGNYEFIIHTSCPDWLMSLLIS